MYTQKLILGAFETPEWATFGLCKSLGAPLRSKNHHFTPYMKTVSKPAPYAQMAHQ